MLFYNFNVAYKCLPLNHLNRALIQINFNSTIRRQKNISHLQHTYVDTHGSRCKDPIVTNICEEDLQDLYFPLGFILR